MTDRPNTPASYGPVQLADFLGLAQWQVERAIKLGLIPPADREPRRWSAAIAKHALAHITNIRAEVGTVPDVGAVRAAGILTDRLGVTVDPDTVLELARTGALTETGDYKGHPLYNGQDLEAFEDRQILATAAENGRLLTADAATSYLRIRRSDFDHLTRSNWLTPTSYGRSAWSRRKHHDVPLYRTGDLNVLLAHPAIDWGAVRATPKGQPSPLARLTHGR